MPPIRSERTLETRENTTQRPEVWTEASQLPDPHPNADYDYRWVRVALRGSAEPGNVSIRMREGWEAVSPSDCPEVALSGTNESTTGHIEMAGHRLCRMTKARANAGKEHYKAKADAQLRGVNMQLQNDDRGKVNLSNDSTSRTVRGAVSFGQGE
jgi:hypothetical protein